MKTNFNSLKKNSWLHFYQMSNIDKQGEFISPILCRGSGIYVYDADNRQYIDAISGAYCVNVGYGRERILQAAYNAAKEIHFVSPFSAANVPAIRLTEKLSQLAEAAVGPESRIFLVNSGSEAVETAVKIARGYARRSDKPQGHKILCRNYAYHGTTFGAMTFSGFDEIKEEFGPLLPGVHHVVNANCTRCPLQLTRPGCVLACASAISNKIVQEGSDTVAAILVETVETSSGIVPPPPGYLQKVCEIKKQHNALLIVDEVITGFGRIGHWFSAEKYGVEADIIVCAKGLTSGYDSLAAVIVRKEVADIFLGSSDATMFKHGATFGGRPAACAAALENIAIMEEENLLKNAENSGQYLMELLQKALSALPIVGEIRHAGLIFGIDLVNEKRQLLTDLTKIRQIREALVEKGLITSLYYMRNEPVIELSPPLTITKSECDNIVHILYEALKEYT